MLSPIFVLVADAQLYMHDVKPVRFNLLMHTCSTSCNEFCYNAVAPFFSHLYIYMNKS